MTKEELTELNKIYWEWYDLEEKLIQTLRQSGAARERLAQILLKHQRLEWERQ